MLVSVVRCFHLKHAVNWREPIRRIATRT